MIEVYPLQFQLGDDSAEWVFYTNALRHISIQYNQSTILPLPLHLGMYLNNISLMLKGTVVKYDIEELSPKSYK